MCKNWTSIEQSRKLIKLGIDINTADMMYYFHHDYEEGDYYEIEIGWEKETDKDIPAWSLSELLKLVKWQYSIDKGSDNSFKVTCLDYVIYEYYLLDAVFELVCKLIKDNKLK